MTQKKQTVPFLTFRAGDGLGTPEAGFAIIRYNYGLGRIELSLDGGPYQGLGGGVDGYLFDEFLAAPIVPPILDGYLAYIDYTSTELNKISVDSLLALLSSASSSLQAAYEAGNSITTGAADGSFSVSGTEDILLSSDSDVYLTALGSLTLGAGGQDVLWPALAGAAGTVLTNDGSGSLSWSAPAGGGSVTSVALDASTTGLTVSGGSSQTITSSGTFTLGGTLATANGGTGTSTAFTPGSVVFAGASGVYAQDNASFFWDDTNNRLGVGTATPTDSINVVGALNAPTNVLAINTNGGANAQAAFIAKSTATTGGFLTNYPAAYTGVPAGISAANSVAVGSFGAVGSTIFINYGTGGKPFYFVPDELASVPALTVLPSGKVGVRAASPAAVVDIVAGTTTSALPGLQITATSGGANSVATVRSSVTSGTTGSVDAAIEGIVSGAAAVAYTTAGVQGVNLTTQTFVDPVNGQTIANAGGPIGVRGVASGVNNSGTQTSANPVFATRGNTGVLGFAANSVVNIGVVGSASITKNNGTNIGVAGQAQNDGSGTAVRVGGLFSLSLTSPNSHDPEYNQSAALIADNCNTTDPVFLARVGGTAKITVKGNGDTDFVGNITKINNVTTSFPPSQGGAGTVLTNDGSGSLSWSSPSSGTITGSGTATQIAYFMGATALGSETAAGSDSFTWDATNNFLGIGVSAPAAPLDIHGPATVDGTSNVMASFADTRSLAAGNGGGFSFAGVYTSGGDLAGWAGISSKKDNSTSGDYAASLVFSTRPNGGANTERMRITSSGDVGIGTTAPSTKLQVQEGDVSIVDGSASAVRTFAIAESASRTFGLGYRNSSAGTGGLLTGGQGTLLSNTDSSGGVILGTVGASAPVVIAQGGNPGLSANVERLRADNVEVVVNKQQQDIDFRVATMAGANDLFVEGSSGNVGIGTSTPTSKLQVVGTSAINDPVAWFGSANTSDANSISLRSGANGFNFFVAGAPSQFMPGTSQGDSGIRADAGRTLFFGSGSTTVATMSTSTGNVGINETNPTSRLVVNGGTAADAVLTVKSSVNGNVATSVINNTSGSAAQASLYLITDPTAGRFSSFAVTSNGWTTNGLSLPNQYQSHPDQGITNGMLFATEAANAPIVFAVPTVNGNGFADVSERLRLNGSEVVINDAAQNVDFLIKGTTGSSALFVDASANAVGIATASPTATFSVAEKLQVDSNGNILKINNVATSWPATQGSSNSVLTNDGSGNLSWASASSQNNTAPIATKTANYTMTSSDGTVLADASSGAITITLPAAASSAERIFTIKKKDVTANIVTVDANASELIDGFTTYLLSTQYEAIKIQSDGTAWWII